MKSKSKIRFLISTFVFIIALIGILGIFYPFKIFDIQFGALAQRVFVNFSIPAVLLLGLVLVSTLLFGRFYCSVICPFGILQELMWLVFKKKSKYIKNYPLFTIFYRKNLYPSSCFLCKKDWLFAASVVS